MNRTVCLYLCTMGVVALLLACAGTTNNNAGNNNAGNDVQPIASQPPPLPGLQFATDFVQQVTIDPTTKRVRAHNEVVTISPGVVVKVKRSRTVSHELSWLVRGELGTTVKTGVPLFVEGQVKT